MSSNTPEQEPRRYLIAIGSSRSPKMGMRDLARVESDIQQIEKLFTSPEQGYQRVLSDQIDLDDGSDNIKTALSNWFASGERRASDCVVIYYAGHGGVEEGKFEEHYLWTWDSSPNKITTTAIKTSSLVECFFPGAGNREYPENILLILDTCYAGAGKQQISEVLSGLKGRAPQGSGFWIVSSTDTNTEAGDGDFVDALTSVMKNPDHPVFRADPDYIDVNAWVNAINQSLESNGKPQQACCDCTNAQKLSQFIRNPRFANLSNRFSEADRLLSLLEPIAIPHLQESYRKAYPECDSQPFPRSPKAILSALIQLPKGVEHRLPRFIDGLIQNRVISEPQRLALQPWATPEASRPPVIQTEPCLMVYVFESKVMRDCYEVLAVLGQQIGNDFGNETTLPVGNAENARFSREQLPRVVADLVEACIDQGVPSQKLTVQCFLPKQLLNLAIEQEEISFCGGQQVIAKVCKSFVVRSLERQLELQKPGRRQADGNWSERWQTLTANWNANCKDIFVLQQANDDQSYMQFYAQLQDATQVGCGFVGSLNPAEDEERFDEIFLTGLPVAVWIRSDPAVVDPGAVLNAVVSDATVGELQQSLAEKRRQARRIRASETDKRVQSVALLWDNPLQPFPSTAYPET
ncbi:MAG: caspase family protein [Oculatellaceae cyanobacterium Prado106]|jgi:hypothetical protein|nr:caspase family protein [Oculatellaceae cyanobacterium Prado106]